MHKNFSTTLIRLTTSIVLILLTLELAQLLPKLLQPTSPTNHHGSQAISRKKPSFQFPAGGQTLSPDYLFVALYGTPYYPSLGVLGEQSVEASISRVKELSAQYQTLTQKNIYPTFEIIASIASEHATDNGDYSEQRPIDELRPWIEAAKKAGVYIVLDLQPGRTDFLTQAKELEPLLREPHVGLALDPEWRLAPAEFHLAQIGHVGISEVNATSQWLADIVHRDTLPQKLFLLHQFRDSMIENRELLDTSRPELDYMIQIDGQGSQEAKQDTWNLLTSMPPPNISFGWKNFYDEDVPLRSPQDTMTAQPIPRYVSYQ